jgi:hypothetical protein
MVVIYQSTNNTPKVKSDNEPNKIYKRANYNIIANLYPDLTNEKKATDIGDEKEPHKARGLKKPANFNSYISHFIDQFEKPVSVPGGTYINVSDVISSVAIFYEKIRTTIEYKGEHLLRRNAIERILKRLIWEKGALRPSINQDTIALALIRELIWAKYIPNNTISNVKLSLVAISVGKYLRILDSVGEIDNKPQRTKKWIIEVASSEIEDILDPTSRNAFIDLIYSWVKENSIWKSDSIDDNEKDIQIYLAVHRAFVRSDNAIMRYYLLKRDIPYWDSLDSNDPRLDEFINGFTGYHKKIENRLNYNGGLLLYRKIVGYYAPFEILRQIFIKNKGKLVRLLSNKSKLKNEIEEVCSTNYKNISKRVNTGIIRSIIYIFVTKVFFALLMEVPYEVYFYGDINYIPLTINIVLPSIMMFFIGLSIKIPDKANTQLIVNSIKKIVFSGPEKKIFINFDDGYSGSFTKIFSMMYIIVFLAVFGAISSLLFKIGYSLFAIIVFYFFLSLVLLFAFRIRHQAQQLKIEPEKEGIFSHLLSYVTLPFLNLGYYLSRGLSQINVLTVLLDILIEAPLKSLLEIFEEWIGYIREKRRNVIEVPE